MSTLLEKIKEIKKDSNEYQAMILKKANKLISENAHKATDDSIALVLSSSVEELAELLNDDFVSEEAKVSYAYMYVKENNYTPGNDEANAVILAYASVAVILDDEFKKIKAVERKRIIAGSIKDVLKSLGYEEVNPNG